MISSNVGQAEGRAAFVHADIVRRFGVDLSQA
jgi:hypothetical protein